jgi:hypothetical protein
MSNRGTSLDLMHTISEWRAAVLGSHRHRLCPIEPSKPYKARVDPHPDIQSTKGPDRQGPAADPHPDIQGTQSPDRQWPAADTGAAAEHHSCHQVEANVPQRDLV